MSICEIWLFHWYFPQFCKSDMSKYGYLDVFQSPLEFEITRADCMSIYIRETLHFKTINLSQK